MNSIVKSMRITVVKNLLEPHIEDEDTRSAVAYEIVKSGCKPKSKDILNALEKLDPHNVGVTSKELAEFMDKGTSHVSALITPLTLKGLLIATNKYHKKKIKRNL